MDILRRYGALIAIVIVGELGIAFALMQWVSSPEEEEAPAEAEVMEEEVEVIEATEPMAIYDKLEEIVVNPSGAGELRTLVVQVDLLLDAETTVQAVGSRLIFVYDALGGVLGKKYIHELDNPEGLMVLKKEMADAVNGVLLQGKVMEVAIKRLVIQ
ncbi:MAG: flagellar basal body-associated FliL family protein [Candidatus Latescibacteria bacterium]|nr:flagellar basal body-associated FliL family protein [Candidatus Latescibacterota bacterium]